MTTVGYGDITPANPYEVILNICMLFLSVGIYSYSFNLIGEVVKEINMGKSEQKSKILRMLERYFFEKKTSLPLRQLLRKEIDKIFDDNIDLSPD
jgi:hypothetical protein